LIDLGTLEVWQGYPQGGGVVAMINRLTDKTNTEGNSPGWYPRVIRIDITPPDSVSGWPYPFDANNTVLYDLLRTTVNYCKTKDLYAIIDWHYIANTYEHVDSTSDFWKYMAPRFANDSHVIFELFNEPINTGGSDNANWQSVRNDMNRWISIVRTYAPNNLILVAGPSYSQTIGPAAAYPLTGDNIAIVSHIYPLHWNSAPAGNNWATTNIKTCLTRYPVFNTEWGFTTDLTYDDQWHVVIGTITNYGQPFMDFREARKISGSAWVASYNWGPPIFYTNWTLRIGEGEMGGFTKDKLYLKRNDDQPSDGTTIPPAAPTGLTATPSTGTVTLDWNDNNDSDLYGYDIYRSTTSGGQANRLNLVRSKTSAYTDTNVAGTRTYYYIVTAVDTNFNSSGNSIEVSAIVPADSTPPAAPSGVSAMAGDTIISLAWNGNTEPDFNGYNVYRSTTPGGPYTKQNGGLLSGPIFNDANVTNGTRYYYVVTAVDTSLNESANSSLVSTIPHIDLPVQILGSWVIGTTHAKESGNNRALVFIVHAEYANSGVSLNSVTYGGQTMTKILDQYVAGSSNRDYVAAYILNNAGINAATNTTFDPNWTGTPTGFSYSSVFLQNVNQITLTGATASATATTATVTTAALSNSVGDMAIDAATCGNTGSYSLTNFTKALEHDSMTSSDGVDGYVSTSGANVTPSATHSAVNRQVLIGFVVKFAPNIAPAAPSGFSAGGAIQAITLDWSNNTELDLAGYNIYRSTISGSGYVKLNSSLLSGSDYTDVNVSSGTTYYYVVTAVDTSGLESVYSGEVSAALASPAIGTGALLREWWSDVPGSTLDDLLSNVNYPDNPSGRQLVTKLEGPVNWGDNYGSRFLGYLNPVTSGSYTFWIACDNMGFLLLSTDDASANLLIIAYTVDPTNWQAWDTYPSQQSSPISLVAGRKYYIEVLQKEDTGNDNVSVAWEGPGISRQVIDGIYLSPCCMEFVDFAGFAAQWSRTDCNADNNWCSGNDFDRNGTVDIEDAMSFANGWLVGNNPPY
jgi:fibronectin type 3 domain-containing protein